MFNIGNDIISNDIIISTYKVSDNVLSLDMCYFEDCTGLTNIILNDTLQSIGASVFNNCINL